MRKSIRKTFKFRLYPNSNQKRELEITLETHRRLYNQALDERIFCYEMGGVSLSKSFQSRRFTILKRENQFYQRINHTSAVLTIWKLDRAFSSFFKRVKSGEKPGFPRFKNEDRFNSVTFSLTGNGGGCRLIGNKLKLQFIGSVRIKLHRSIEGKIKQCTILREGEKWFACFSCEIEHKPEPKVGPAVGIDVGLSKFATISDGQEIKNPRLLKDSIAELRREQRSLARKKMGGSNRRKQKSRVVKLHAKIRNKRKEFHFQEIAKLVRRYGLIAVESLDIKGMLESGRLSRSISDAGWGQFITRLQFKAEEAGVAFVKVLAAGTSQECSECGREVKKTLHVRTHSCPHCGFTMDRDQNAARNILNRGLKELARTEPTGVKLGVA